MILERLESLIPRWMLDAANVQYSRLMALPASLVDAAGEAILQARFAWLPGQLDVPGGNGFDNFDALKVIGRDRGIRQGLLESPYDYAARLRAWLDDWARAATPYELLEQLAAILSPNPPRLFLVTAGGTWWVYVSGVITQYTQDGSGIQYQTDGTLAAVTDVPHAWDWDHLTVPAPLDKDDNSRFWIGIDCPCNAPYLAATDSTFNDPGLVDDYAAAPNTSGAGLSPDAGTVGTVSPRQHVELIRGLVYEWRAAGLRCAYVIVNFTAGAFFPLTDSSPTSIPDGRWGWHSTYDAATQSRIVARFPGAEYWPGDPGGIRLTPNP